MNRSPQSEVDSRISKNGDNAIRMSISQRRRHMSAAERASFESTLYEDLKVYEQELDFHIRMNNFSDAARLLGMKDLWREKPLGHDLHPELKKEINNFGDEYLTGLTLEELKRLHSVGFDPRLASDGVLKYISQFPYYAKESEELRKIFGDKLYPYWEQNTGSPKRVFKNRGLVVKSVDRGTSTLYDEIRRDALEEDLKDLVKLSPCFASLTLSYQEPADFCYLVHNLFAIDIPTNIENKVSKFQGEKGLAGDCEFTSNVVLGNRRIQFSTPGSPAEHGLSEVDILPFKKIRSGSSTISRADVKNRKKVPLYTFFKAASKFCKSIVINVESDDEQEEELFNQHNINKFEDYFYTPDVDKGVVDQTTPELIDTVK